MSVYSFKDNVHSSSVPEGLELENNSRPIGSALGPDWSEGLEMKGSVKEQVPIIILQAAFYASIVISYYFMLV